MNIGLVAFDGLARVTGGNIYDRMLVDYLREAGETVELIPVPFRGYRRSLLVNLSSPLARRLTEARFDLLIEDELIQPAFFWLNRRLIRAARYPIISIVHHLRCSEPRPQWQNLLVRQIERRYLATVDGFIYNSETTRREVESLTGNARPGVVAPPGGDRLPEEPSRKEIVNRVSTASRLRVLFIGHLTPRKSLHVLIAALATLPEEAGWSLMVVGDPQADPAYSAAQEARVQALGLDDRVQFVGQLSDEKLAEQLTHHDLLAVPSSYEGFGMVYLEAMRCGLPAIASAAGGGVEVVKDGENGFLIGPGDVGGLADRLRVLAENRDLLREMSLAARESYEHAPTWSESLSRIYDFLRRFAT